MWKEVTRGEGAGSLVNLKDYEEALAEGQRGKLSLFLTTSVPSGIAEELQNKLVGAGVLDAAVLASGTRLDIQFRKGLPWLAIIVAAVLGLIVLAILIISWQFFKEVAEVVPQPIIIIAVVVGIVLMAIIAYTLARKQIPIKMTGGKVT